MLLAVLLLFLNAFASRPARADWLSEHWEKVPPSALPALTPDGDYTAFRKALTRQRENCAEARSGHYTHCGTEPGGLPLSCDDRALSKLTTLARQSRTWSELYSQAKKEFDWYRYKAPEKVLFTGYNSPLFDASPERTEQFQWPIYGLPPDLVVTNEGPRRLMPGGSLGPYFDRRAIETDHVLAGKKLEIAWLATPTDILRLQTEGSGVLRYPDGHEVGANYAGKNGRPYVSIFKILKDRGVDKKYLTFPGLKQYLKDFPKETREALDQVPSYVFFSLAKEPPCSSSRANVTGGHSVAVDPTQVGLGSAVFFSAERPVEGTPQDSSDVPVKPFTRFAFANDTGGTIKGAHVDVYWGTGDYAMLASNSMKSKGVLYLLRSKDKK
jgi:membrane-bound lytic murein transglycosylase A